MSVLLTSLEGRHVRKKICLGCSEKQIRLSQHISQLDCPQDWSAGGVAWEARREVALFV